MRKHIISELGSVAVNTDDLGNSKTVAMWMGDTQYTRAIGDEARNYLVDVADRAILNMSEELPKGMKVTVYFSVLPEHEKEILEGINDVVLP